MTGTHRADDDRSPEELREELGELRAELGDTVEELAHRADVPTRLREKRDETAQRVQAQVAHARDTIADTAPVVQSTLRERPALVSGIAVALTFLLISLVWRRRNRRDGDGTR
jgi:ElaB/YqjD/DUF883 family membrane-anchored ribosome-binding protein